MLGQTKLVCRKTLTMKSQRHNTIKFLSYKVLDSLQVLRSRGKNKDGAGAPAGHRLNPYVTSPQNLLARTSHVASTHLQSRLENV